MQLVSLCELLFLASEQQQNSCLRPLATHITGTPITYTDELNSACHGNFDIPVLFCSSSPFPLVSRVAMTASFRVKSRYPGKAGCSSRMDHRNLFLTETS
jgi:hypothetical protein